MRSETLSLVISGDGKQLGAELGRQESRVRSFGSKVGSMMAGVGKRIGGAVGKLANPLALLGGTAGIVMAARDLAEYQDKLSTLGISAGLSAEQMMGLEKRIQSAAYTTGQARDGLADAAKVMADITGDNDFAASSLEAVGRAATATSMDITSTAQAFATFKRDMGATGDEAAQLFNTMAALGNTQSMDRFARSAQALGLTKDNFAGYNAMIKTLAPTMGGSVDAAANAIDQIAITLQTKGGGALKHHFRDALDSKGAIKDYAAFMKAIGDMNPHTRKAMFGKFGANMTGADVGKMAEAFDTYIKKAENASYVSDAFARKQGEAKYQMNLLSTAAKDFAGSALAPVIADITRELSVMTGNPAQMEAFRSGLADIAGGFAALGGAVGKALGLWGDMWGKIGEVYNDPLGMRKESAGKVDKMDPNLRAALLYKYGYNDMDIAGKSKKYMNKDGTVNTQRLDALMQENRDAHAAKRAAAEVQNKIAVNVNIAPDGRVVAEVDGANTSATATANRGKF
jgi:hypothetical protein